MPSTPDDRFYLELTRLLLHVATSDDELQPEELHALVSAARRWRVPDAEVQGLVRTLEEKKPLPAPNLGLLRQHPQEVIDSVHALITSDAEVHFSEEEMLAQVRELLGLPPEA